MGTQKKKKKRIERERDYFEIMKFGDGSPTA